jgi:hypothetical protein
VQATQPRPSIGETKQALYKLFAAYIHTIPLEELIESVERARLDARLRYVVLYGVACSYCIARAERLEGSYLRMFALELKEQLAQTLAAFVTSILAGPRWCLDAESAGEPPLRQVIDVLQQVMCCCVYKPTHKGTLSGQQKERCKGPIAEIRDPKSR